MSAIRELPEHSRFEPFPIREPSTHSSDNVVDYKPDPVCGCGCGNTVKVKEFITQDGEWIFAETCWTQISYKEGWIRRVAI